MPNEELDLEFVSNRDDLRERYALQNGVTAGHLPSTLERLDDWLDVIVERAADDASPERPSIRHLREVLESDAELSALVETMFEQAHGTTRPPQPPIHDIETLLRVLNHILGHAPTPDNSFPVSGVFLHFMYTRAGWQVFRNKAFNHAMAGVLDEWETFLDSRASTGVINAVDGWLAPASQRAMDLKDFEIDWSSPTGGFHSYNGFFHRQIKPGVRQLAGPGQRNVIVSANDGVVYKIARDVKLDAKFWTKDQPYSLGHMLGDRWGKKFVGGDVFQTFLAGTSYHRWMAPVTGTVVEVEVVPGLMFSELHSVGWDPGGGTKSTAYEASVNTRGIVIIDSGDATIGLVAVIPIGITEVSSVKHLYPDGSAVDRGDVVTKGQEIGRFSLGGSTLALVFQRGAIDQFRFDWPPKDKQCPPAINARDWIALARTDTPVAPGG